MMRIKKKSFLSEQEVGSVKNQLFISDSFTSEAKREKSVIIFSDWLTVIAILCLLSRSQP